MRESREVGRRRKVGEARRRRKGEGRRGERRGEERRERRERVNHGIESETSEVPIGVREDHAQPLRDEGDVSEGAAGKGRVEEYLSLRGVDDEELSVVAGYEEG